MPPTAPSARIDLNSSSISDLDALKAHDISPATIASLKRFRGTGAHFKSPKDLEAIGLSSNAITELMTVGTIVFPAFPPLRPLPVPKPAKSATISVVPTGLIGHELRFAAHAPRSTDVVLDGESPVPADGKCVLRYEDAASRGTNFDLTMRGPDGGLLEIERDGKKGFRLEVPETELEKHPVKVTARAVITRPGSTSVAPPAKLRGRVICADPARKVTGLPVVIFVAITDSPKDDEFFPICSAETEDGGYFVTGVPIIAQADYAKLTAAKAHVGQTPIPVRLDVEPVTKAKVLPHRIILVLDSAATNALAPVKDDCGCEELNFLEKRVLDEFTYFTVVRTTEPKIEAMHIDDVAEIDLADLLPPSDPLRGLVGGLTLPPGVLNSYLDRNPALDMPATEKLAAIARAHQVRKIVRPPVKKPRGRVVLDGTVPGIDWDETPTIYQATTVAHGHLLQFKQEWYSDGYSIGDLLYSLPLAPGQKKQIVVFDWDRKDSASNTQQTDYQDSLYNSLSRDRDVNEVARATLHETIEGESETSAYGWGVGGGAGAAVPIPAGPVVIPVGALVGAGGGGGGASSSASQEAARETTASSHQKLSDRTVQAANTVRSQRSTVIQTVAQGERFQVSAEVVANYNHCHALTIQYFEVIRHFEIRSRLAAVQECLFVPLRIAPFTRRKALRWRNILAKCLKNRFLVRGFAALERVEQEFESSTDNYYDQIDVPKTRFAEESLQYVEGELRLEFQFRRPLDDDKGERIAGNWSHLTPLLGQDFFALKLAALKDRDSAFVEHAGPRLARFFIDRLRFHATKSTGQRQQLLLDATLMSDFKADARLLVSLRMAGAMPTIRREDIDFLEISVDQTGASYINKLLLENVRVIVHAGSMRYRTKHLHEELFRQTHIDNDLTVSGDNVRIYTPLSAAAARNPRLEDVELHDALLHHLNECLEYYHQCIWLKMDAQRRFLLIDGIAVPGRGLGRSVASLAENRLIGVVGNCLVLPVAPGYRLDPALADDLDLFAHYHHEPPDPSHVSLPTKGVYAEAVMGQCNSCERKEEDRFWRWEESPIPDSPTTINPITLPTPVNQQPNLQPQPLTAPIINLQNAPNAPDPQGFGALTQLLANPNLFRDITGLTENQKNAISALQRAFQSSEFFGGKAAELTNLAAQLTPAGQKLESIRQARANNLLDQEGAKVRAETALDTDSGVQNLATLRQLPEIAQKLRDAGVDPEISKRIVNGLADQIGKVPESPIAPLMKVPTTSRGEFEAEVRSPAGDVQSVKFTPQGAGGANAGESAISILRDGLVSGAGKAGDAILDGLSRWTSEPGSDLEKVLQKALVEAARKEALKVSITAVKRIPVGGALVEGIKFALAFAEGAGKELEATNRRLRAEYADKMKLIFSSDEITNESFDAMRELSSYQLNATQELNGILRAGIDGIVNRAVDLGLETLGGFIKDNLTEFLRAIAKENELLALLNGFVKSSTDGIPDARKQVEVGLLAFLVKGFVKQLPKSALQTGLKSTLDTVRGTADVPSDMVAGLCFAILQVETTSIGNQLGISKDEIKRFLVGQTRRLMDAGGILPLRPASAGEIEVKTAEILVPQTLITLIQGFAADGKGTREMKAAGAAVRAFADIESQKLKDLAFKLLIQVRNNRLARSQAAGTVMDENGRATRRVGRAFRECEALLQRLAQADNDPFLTNEAPRREFMFSILDVPRVFFGTFWDPPSAHPETRSFRLTELAALPDDELEL